MTATRRTAPMTDTTRGVVHRVVAAVTLIAWTGWSIACSGAQTTLPVPVPHDAALAIAGHAAHAHHDGDTRDGAVDDCCTALKDLTASLQSHDLKPTAFSKNDLPRVVADLVFLPQLATAAVTPSWEFHGPPAFPRRSSTLSPLWPHAPPC